MTTAMCSYNMLTGGRDGDRQRGVFPGAGHRVVRGGGAAAALSCVAEGWRGHHQPGAGVSVLAQHRAARPTRQAQSG